MRRIDRDGERYELRDYLWREHVIWGATGAILRRLLEEVGVQLGVAH